MAGGFDGFLSFYYTSMAATGAVRVYDGLDGTGNLLASITLDALDPDFLHGGPGAYDWFTQWALVGVKFEGIAKSAELTARFQSRAKEKLRPRVCP